MEVFCLTRNRAWDFASRLRRAALPWTRCAPTVRPRVPCGSSGHRGGLLARGLSWKAAASTMPDSSKGKEGGVERQSVWRRVREGGPNYRASALAPSLDRLARLALPRNIECQNIQTTGTSKHRHIPDRSNVSSSIRVSLLRTPLGLRGPSAVGPNGQQQWPTRRSCAVRCSSLR